MDLRMDFSNGKHDMVFVNGSCPITGARCPVTGDRVDVVTQRLYIRLRTFFGEWWLDSSYGVPWFERILGKKVRKGSVDIVIQEQILAERGVAEIVEFSSSLDVPNRIYQCKFKVRVDTGDVSGDIII